MGLSNGFRLSPEPFLWFHFSEPAGRKVKALELPCYGAALIIYTTSLHNFER